MQFRKSSSAVFGATCIAALGAFAAAGPLEANGYRVLYSFCVEQNCADGSEPNGLVEDPSGDLYGTVFHGGPQDAGGIFELKREAHGYAYELLYGFCRQANCADGEYPNGGLILDTNGNVYGVTLDGGSQEFTGEVFELKRGKRSWSLQVLYCFCEQTNCADGSNPEAGLAYAGQQSGALYDGTSPLFGTTANGGSGGTAGVYGVAYEIAPGRSGWTYQVIYDFCSLENCADGGNPNAALTEDSAGGLYGTTAGGGGPNDAGTAFGLANSGGSWSESVLYSFCALSGCSDGAFPEGGLVIDSSGNLDGTTAEGGFICSLPLANGCGIAYTLTPGGAETVGHTFCTRTKCRDGAYPVGTPAADADGRLYAATEFGGDFANTALGGGTLYELDSSTFTLLHKFCAKANCADGGETVSPPIRNSAGNLLGTATIGGTNNGGVVYEYTK